MGKENRTDSWTTKTREILKKIGLNECWERQYTEEAEEKWNKRIKSAIENKENVKWEEERKKSSRLRTYNKIKERREVETYMDNRDVVGRSIMGRLRAGANFLRIDTGREMGEERNERICRTCHKEIED